MLLRGSGVFVIPFNRRRRVFIHPAVDLPRAIRRSPFFLL
jgi:hypothetical protein